MGVVLLFLIGLMAGSYFFGLNQSPWVLGDNAHAAGDLDEPREISGIDLDGGNLKLSNYRGKIVLLCFWDGEDVPWVQLHAYQTRLQKKFAGKPFTILGVSAHSSRPDAREAMRETGVTWRCWHDGPQGPIAKAWDVDEFPTFFLIDAEGHEYTRYNLFLIEEEVEMDVRRLLRSMQ
jgi:peroxiredoxin